MKRPVFENILYVLLSFDKLNKVYKINSLFIRSLKSTQYTFETISIQNKLLF